jgi:serine/threonine protein kinase
MAAEITVAAFLDLLRRSGLVQDSLMLSLMAEFSGETAKSLKARAVADELIKRGLLTEWQADNLMLGKHRGFFLGPHRILRPFGQGGMSRVFLAEHEMMRRRCAIKILPGNHQADPDLLRRFRLEAMAIAALDHPHIVRAYDFNRDIKYGKEIDYLVMEYVEGLDLRRMVEEQGPLDYRKAADYIAQAAEGLAHAHASGLVHRDVKPANLLVDPNGVLKILDLGLARATFEDNDAWQTPEGEQSAVGTADYVAPEQVMDSNSADGRADIYSLGYTFYYLLTGRRPFPKSTLVELLMAHRVENPEPIAKIRPDVPAELIDIVAQMTAKTPELRVQTATEVAEKLKAWLQESESSREYSRISALMAAAMRTKQSAEETGEKSESSKKEKDLELALIDEDVTAQAWANPSSGRRSETRKPAQPKERPKKAGPADSGKTPVVSKAKADLLLDMIPDQSRLSPVVLPQIKYRGGTNNILKSPWLWVSVAAILVAVIVLVVAVTSGSSGSPHQKPPSVAVPKPAEANNDAITASALPVVPVPPSVEKPPASESANDTAIPADIARPRSLPDVVPSPPPSPPQEPPSVATPQPPKDEHPAPKPEIAPLPKKPIDAETALAGLATLAFRWQSADADLNNPLYRTVARQAMDVAKAVHLKLNKDADAPNVMSIDVKTANEADNFTVVISAELICRDPAGGSITAWKRDKKVVSVDSRRSRPEQVLKLLRTESAKFFEQFADEIRRARTKLGTPANVPN